VKVPSRALRYLEVVSLVVLVLAIIVSQSVRPARALTVSTFVGTTYTNEHFQMVIGSQGAVVYDLSGSLLVQKMYWSIEEENFGSLVQLPNGTLTLVPSSQQWSFMNWTSGPFLSTQQIGSYNRVAVSGVMNNSLAVNIYYDGLSVGNASMGPKISVGLQSLSGYGVYRVHWDLQGIQPNIFSIENRNGTVRNPIYGPVTLPGTVTHSPAGENSLVALASDGATILFGMNWQDAIQYYRGLLISKSSFGSVIDAAYGDFSLGLGQSIFLDPYYEGGGPDPLPVTISNVQVSANSVGGTTAAVTWATSPSGACDTFAWGTTTSYGNTVNAGCGTHSVSLSGLSTHTTYYYQISSTASSYATGTYSSSFYPTIASGARADERYSLSSAAAHDCYGIGSYSVAYTVESEMPGSIVYNPTTAGSTQSYQVWDLYVGFSATGVDFPWYCGQTLATYSTHIDLWVYDNRDHSYNWIAARGPPFGVTSVSGTGTTQWTFSGQINAGPFSFSASYSNSPSSGTSTSWGFYSAPVTGSDGWDYFGGFNFYWPTVKLVSFGVLVPILVYDFYAQNRFLDQILIRVGYTNTFMVYDSNGWLAGWQEGYSIYLGDGTWNPTSIIDQYTSVQQGTSGGCLTSPC
jgi:hypothetical protein